MTSTPHSIFSGDKIEKNEMGEARSAYGREERRIQGLGNVRENNHLKNPGTDGRIILRWILRKWDVEVFTGSSWLGIGTLVNTAVTFRCP